MYTQDSGKGALIWIVVFLTIASTCSCVYAILMWLRERDQKYRRKRDDKPEYEELTKITTD